MHLSPALIFREGDGEDDGSFHKWAICSVGTYKKIGLFPATLRYLPEQLDTVKQI